MALEILSVSPISAECKRLFLLSKRMVSPIYRRLESSIIVMAQVLWSWVRAGIINGSVINVVNSVLSTKNHL